MKVHVEMDLHFRGVFVIRWEAARESVLGKTWRRKGPIVFIDGQNRRNNFNYIECSNLVEIKMDFLEFRNRYFKFK